MGDVQLEAEVEDGGNVIEELLVRGPFAEDRQLAGVSTQGFFGAGKRG